MNINRKKIAIIDDNKTLLEELSEILKSVGYETNTADDLDSGIVMIKEFRPDLLLLDLKLKQGSGFELADRMRMTDNLPDIPIIAMTGYFTEKDHKLAMSICGIKKSLIKPLDIECLIDEIENVLSAVR